MVRLRLRRVGAKKQPSYRIVATEKETARDGRFLEILGFYNPRTDPATLELQEARIYDWMSKGAQPSDSVRHLFQSAGLLDRFERFKQGEAVEVLLAEAGKTPGSAAADADTSSAKTSRPAKSSQAKA